MIISCSAIDIIPAMSGNLSIVQPARSRFIGMFSVLICFISLYMICMNHASAKGQTGEAPPRLFGAFHIQAGNGLQQQTLTHTPSVTASVTLSSTQTITATLTLTPTEETVTPSPTDQQTSSPRRSCSRSRRLDWSLMNVRLRRFCST